MNKLVSRSDDTYLVFLFTLPPHSTPMYMQVDGLGSGSGRPGQCCVHGMGSVMNIAWLPAMPTNIHVSKASPQCNCTINNHPYHDGHMCPYASVWANTTMWYLCSKARSGSEVKH